MPLAVDIVDLEAQLLRHEGLRLKVYPDTEGVLTIGVGRNLQGRGITREEALYLLRNDVWDVLQAVQAAFPWAAQLTPTRQQVLCNMAFNLGLPRLKQFRKMLTACERGEYDTAARQMMNSLWAKQVGQRAVELAQMMRNG
jgi:lysozyme